MDAKTLTPEAYAAAVKGRIKTVVKERSGPSFDERIAAASSRMRKQANAEAKVQNEKINQAVAKAKARPNESSTRLKKDAPESIESRAARGLQVVKSETKEHWKKVQELRHRMATRDPLFKLTEVAAGFALMKQRQKDRQTQLKKDEADMWEFLNGMKIKVLDNPLLVEQARAGDWLEKRAQDAMVRAWPLERTTPLDQKITRAMSDSSFTKSDWTRTVNGLREKMDNREKLHEITYPKKWEDPPPAAKSALRAKIEADIQAHTDLRMADMAKAEREQRKKIKELEEAGWAKSPMLGVHKIKRNENYKSPEEIAESKQVEMAAASREQWAKIKEIREAGYSRPRHT